VGKEDQKRGKGKNINTQHAGEEQSSALDGMDRQDNFPAFFMNDGGDRLDVPEQHAQEQQHVQGIEVQQQDLLGRMMAYLNLIISLQAACRRLIQRARTRIVRSFEEIPGTRKKDKNGQRKATLSCKCCPPSRFGEDSEDGTWSLDLYRAVGWKNPITMRLSLKEFERGCRDHVRSKNGRHMFWETVERVDKMPTSPSQEDLKNLAAGGQILETLFRKYVESWNGYENINDYEKEREEVMTKFEQARRVLKKLQIEIRPL
jgi:hypothetical protein